MATATALPARPLVFVAILLACPNAVACELSLVAPATSALKNPVQVHASVTEDALVTRFSVSAPSLNAKKVLGPREYSYQFDVVELFVTFSETGFPYYEFEVSPYNQTFQVRIASAKEHHEGVDLGLTSTAALVTGGWNAELTIPLKPLKPLKPLGWDGDLTKIRGNFHSILGQGQQRSYWSAFSPKAKKPNFHQPQYFKPLVSCS
jgi:hypothetical protein